MCAYQRSFGLVVIRQVARLSRIGAQLMVGPPGHATASPRALQRPVRTRRQPGGPLAEAAEQAATDKLEKIRIDQQLRLEGLERELQKVQEQAQVVEWNADNVEKALQVINSALDSGMDWEQLEQLVQVEQEENHNPIALLIYQLDLDSP